MTLSNSETTAVGRLLLNAWSAEYALRIKPPITDKDYLNKSLSWTFPQAYYAVLFSVRAVLASDGIRMANEEQIQKLVGQWATLGKDGPAFTLAGNPFEGLNNYRISSTRKPSPMSSPEAAALHIYLIKRVEAVNLILETYILNRLGADAYRLLIDNLPEYLRIDFVGSRANSLIQG